MLRQFLLSALLITSSLSLISSVQAMDAPSEDVPQHARHSFSMSIEDLKSICSSPKIINEKFGAEDSINYFYFVQVEGQKPDFEKVPPLYKFSNNNIKQEYTNPETGRAYKSVVIPEKEDVFNILYIEKELIRETEHGINYHPSSLCFNLKVKREVIREEILVFEAKESNLNSNIIMLTAEQALKAIDKPSTPIIQLKVDGSHGGFYDFSLPYWRSDFSLPYWKSILSRQSTPLRLTLRQSKELSIAALAAGQETITGEYFELIPRKLNHKHNS